MSEMVELSVQELLELHRLGMQKHGGLNRVPEEAPARLGSALFTASYQENPLGYAAALLFYIATAQHFPDGNKRLAFSACVRALEVNGLTVEVDDETGEAFVIGIVERNESHSSRSAEIISDIAEQLADWLVEVPV